MINRYGMKLNVAKCEYVEITSDNDTPVGRLLLNGEELKRVKSFKYLGSKFEENRRK